MALISLQEVRIAFGGPELIDGVTLQLERRERVCLVGRNGEGKSTLMKIVSGEITPDAGEVIYAQGVRIASLAQEVPQGLSGTVFEIVAGGLGNMVDLLSEYRSASHRLAHGEDAGAIAGLERIQHLIESSGGWQIQQKVETVLSRLRLDPDTPVAELSGGYKRRVLLAQALVSEPDLLLLDEPTNHLDIASIGWLEEFLIEFRGSILFITHDRRFLRTLATRIVELDRGRITDWPGDYATYLARRQAELDAEATHNALFDKKLAQEETWIRQGIKARRTRNEGRVTALKEMRRERLARREKTGSAAMRLNEAERSGKLVLEARGVWFGYEGSPLIKDFSTIIMRGDKIGVIGPNGSGKTTLLNILLGSMEPHHGSVRKGTRLEVAYFDQHRAQLVDNRSVMDNVADGNEYVTVNGRTRHVIGYLEDFLFPSTRARSPVKVLSGGERNRALLAKLFTKPSNVLVMDEPTNDLDTDTLELLEEMLMEYEGAVLLVSHDREFLNNIVTGTIVFEGDGRLAEYVGGYDDWLRQRRSAVPGLTGKTEKAVKAAKQAKPRSQQERPRTLTFKEKEELEALPALIEALEAERDKLYETFADPDFYKQDGSRLTAAKERIEELEKEITTAYERWELLETIRQMPA
ncbi:MAG: ATP-binding cassette domain-containing protein [Nitrospirae bacterium]|nr:ATP-binding cassette domain-containing protein [Nitrospirota bacterium]MCL5237241.1 ATP-binding cassette domain-containing protein [Nitrospirota bacterium]